MTEKEELIVYHEFITIDGEVPPPAISLINKRLEKIAYVVGAFAGVIVYFLLTIHW